MDIILPTQFFLKYQSIYFPVSHLSSYLRLHGHFIYICNSTLIVSGNVCHIQQVLACCTDVGCREGASYLCLD
jgi:hypothetical protein